MFPRKKLNDFWEGVMEPFQVVGNVYFVGTYQASSHLIDTGDGLILIDTGYAESLYFLVRSILQLGYHPRDIKYIVNTHWHWDHAEATKPMVKLSGAKTLIGWKDAEKARQFFEPDILIRDGDTLTLGNTTLTFLETPGHTEGTVSFFFDVVEDEAVYRAGMFGGAGANTLAYGQFDYPHCREDYRASVRRLQKEPVDVFIGNHVWNNDTEGKALLKKQGEKNPFIDPELWHTFLTFCEQRLDAAIQKDPKQ